MTPQQFIAKWQGCQFPLEILEMHQSVELIAAVHMGTKRKHPIKLYWSDDFSDKNEKVVYPTLYPAGALAARINAPRQFSNSISTSIVH